MSKKDPLHWRRKMMLDLDDAHRAIRGASSLLAEVEIESNGCNEYLEEVGENHQDLKGQLEGW